MKKVLLLASEALPFAATGGLGDVIGSLPAALVAGGRVDARVMLPLYRETASAWRAQLREVVNVPVTLAWRQERCKVYTLTRDGVIFYFLEAPQYFDRDGLYGHFDDAERFAFFCMAALCALPRLDFYPDVLHANDWQAALSVIYLRTHFGGDPAYRGIRTLFTIHNIAYQGKFPHAILEDVLGLDASRRSELDFDGCINLMKGAILYADRVSTVSPRYAEEICTGAHGCGLDGILRENAHKLCGILNGIDVARYDPATSQIARPFTWRSIVRKRENKQALQRELGLAERVDVPLFAVVSRLAAHKGLDLVAGMIHTLLQEDVQLVLLGCGDPGVEDFFRELEAKNKHRVCAYIGYERALATRIYAGCDLFLMPSRSEPCGLSQMIASRYGAIPVVRGVGGLADSIQPYRAAGEEIEGNGFVFFEDSPEALLGACRAALAVWRDTPARAALVRRVMRTDFSWARSACAYEQLYAEL